MADFASEGFDPGTPHVIEEDIPQNLGDGIEDCRIETFVVVALVAAQAIKENVVRLTFSRDVLADGLEELGDALRAANYTFAPGDGAEPIGAREVFRVPGTDRQVDVVLDRPMTAYPVTYSVAVANVVAGDGSPLSSLTFAQEFLGTHLTRVPPVPENKSGVRDFANPQTLRGAMDPVPSIVPATLGTLPIDDSGDYAADEGLEYLRKRVFRRLVTRKGGFYHLPTYGVGIPAKLKHLSRADQLREIQDDATRQLLEEPGVSDARVTLSTVQHNGATLLRVGVRVKAAGRLAAWNFSFPMDGAGDGALAF